MSGIMKCLMAYCAQFILYLLTVMLKNASDVITGSIFSFWFIIIHFLYPIFVSVFCNPNKIYKIVICLAANYIVMNVIATLVLKDYDTEGMYIFSSSRIIATIIMDIILSFNYEHTTKRKQLFYDINGLCDEVRIRHVKRVL